MPLQSNTGEVTGPVVLFRKGQTRPLGIEQRVPDGAGIVRKIAQGGKQQMLLYVTAIVGPVSINDIEVYSPLVSDWISILGAPLPLSIGETVREPVETYAPETFVRVTMSSDTNDHVVECVAYTP